MSTLILFSSAKAIGVAAAQAVPAAATANYLRVAKFQVSN
jgi:hypothetical protein